MHIVKFGIKNSNIQIFKSVFNIGIFSFELWIYVLKHEIYPTLYSDLETQIQKTKPKRMLTLNFRGVARWKLAIFRKFWTMGRIVLKTRVLRG